MAIENNRTSSELFHENAYTNNTFSLPETERAIKSTLENSYKYLMSLQKSYISIARFTKTEQDLFFDSLYRPCISLDKDFIDSSKRKPYKMSEFYNTYVDIQTISSNPDIFMFIPLVMVDDKITFAYKVKSALDGNTDILFTGIPNNYNFMSEQHIISVVFLKNLYFHQFTTNRFVVEKYAYKLPQSITKISSDDHLSQVFFLMRDTTETYGTNFFIGQVDENNNLVLDENDDVLYDYLLNHKDIEFTILVPSHMIELSGTRQIFNRIDNNRQSATFVLEYSEWEHYKMPIPVNNILLFRRNKITDELTYENSKDIILHYPNIYEVMSDDVDAELYEYKIFYFYRNLQEYLGYENSLKYIYRYFARRLDCTYEEMVRKLLYEKNEDEKLQNYFLKFFNYEDPSYQYSHSDFFSTLKPYDFDYKTEKMKEFLEKNPYTFIPYAKKVGNPYQSYYLYVKNIDLEKRLRNDTTQEAILDEDVFYFENPFYVFMFANEGRNNLNLRFFIDGIFCDAVFQLHIGTMEYLYIPQSYIKEDSFIFIERFETYVHQDHIRFSDRSTPVTLVFDKNEFIQPTLFDLFVVDENLNDLDRSKFKIYALVNSAEYDVSDYIGVPKEDVDLVLKTESYYEDPETKELYILIGNDTYEDDEDTVIVDLDDESEIMHTGRLPLKYISLTKLKIFCDDADYLNRDLTFIINKIPYLSINQMAKKGLPKIRLFTGDIPWKKEPSFIRTFVNGRFQPMEFDIISKKPDESYLVPRCYLREGDILSIDVTPYSYELEFYMEEIPENFMVKFNSTLSKPFDLGYYDVYLNGRKLDHQNIQLITPDVVQLFNVKSRKNLRIYRRDRDYEYYGFTKTPSVSLDEILESPDIPEPDKDDIIFDIIYNDSGIPKDEVTPGTDIEWDNENLETIPAGPFQIYRFYLDVILNQRVARPNELFIDKNLVRDSYEEVWNLYANPDRGRIVIRPNIGHRDATIVLMLGHPYDVDSGELVPDPTNLINKTTELVGDTSPLVQLADGTIVGTVNELFRRMGRLAFRFNDDNSLRVDFIATDDNDFVRSFKAMQNSK